jgi:hypothetical protein
VHGSGVGAAGFGVAWACEDQGWAQEACGTWGYMGVCASWCTRAEGHLKMPGAECARGRARASHGGVWAAMRACVRACRVDLGRARNDERLVA